MNSIAPCSYPASLGKPYKGGMGIDMEVQDGGMVCCLYTEDLYLRPVRPTDIDEYIKLFSDSQVMRTFETGITWPADITRNQVAIWSERWTKGDPYSAFSVFQNKDNAFVGHIIMRYGENLLFGNDDSDGYSEIAYAYHKKFWGNGYGKQCAAVLLKTFIPRIKSAGYRVHTMCSENTFRKCNLKWITATALVHDHRYDRSFTNVGSVKILTGLGFKMMNVCNKYGHFRGVFGLKV